MAAFPNDLQLFRSDLPEISAGFLRALEIISAQNPPFDPMLFAVTAREFAGAFE